MVTEIKSEVALADAQAPAPPPQTAGLDRLPAHTKLRITSKAEGRDRAGRRGDPTDA